MPQLTYREAAKRVHRSVRTIKRWRKSGMPMGMVNGFRVVEEETLLKWWRDRMNAWPPHQWRMRNARQADAQHQTENGVSRIDT